MNTVASPLHALVMLAADATRGLAVGLIETYSGVLLGSAVKNLVPFVLLMLLLVFRPQGLFGTAEVKRV